ncbi:MAG: GNAT family N-acetyltransferase [Firmicutes bacterium]|nr:GNAT family N-acetyltransferase [Bacillota bacterium]
MSRIKVPILETQRLVLRGWKKKDAADLYAYAKSPNVGPHAGWKPHADIRESRMIITQMFQQNMTWAITIRGEDIPIGSIGFEPDAYRPHINSREMGYSMNEDYWGQGIMTEAARRLLKYGFEELGLATVMIRTGEANKRSQRVIEKCGFHYEGTLRQCYRMYNGEIRDSRVYSMLREEYEELVSLEPVDKMW